MGKTKAGDLMIALLMADGHKSVCLLDDYMSDVGHQLWPDVPHPINRAIRASQHLRRDERFRKSRIHAHDSRGRARVLTLYTIKDTATEETPND